MTHLYTISICKMHSEGKEKKRGVLGEEERASPLGLISQRPPSAPRFIFMLSSALFSSDLARTQPQQLNSPAPNLAQQLWPTPQIRSATAHNLVAPFSHYTRPSLHDAAAPALHSPTRGHAGGACG
jgi:hypothetical protein